MRLSTRLFAAAAALIISLPATAMAAETNEQSGSEPVPWTEETPLPPPLVQSNTEDIVPEAIAADVRALNPSACQKQVLTLVNAERAKVGAPALKALPGLNDLSMMWSEWMAITNNFSHLPSVYGWGLFSAAGARGATGENIAAGYATPADVVAGWMNSPGHRSNILNREAQYMGVGCAEGYPTSTYDVYWTQQFASATGTPEAGHEIPIPTDQLKPRITGKATVGETLGLSLGGPLPTGTSLTYQWLADGTKIQGATGSTLKLVDDQAGKRIGLTLKAKNDSRFYEQTSIPVPTMTNKVLKVTRYGGSDRYGTNLALNQAHMKPARPLFVATGAAYPDALSIGPVVSLTEGSLVLTPRNGLTADSLNLIKSRKPSQVFVIGGTGAVPDRVVDQLRSATSLNPIRVGGSDRYATSAMILDQFFQNRSFSTALVATGRDFPDALSAAAAGGSLGVPVVLVDGKNPRSQIPASAAMLLKQKKITSLQLVGGTGAITPAVTQNISGQGFRTARLQGPTRYETNLAVNNYVNNAGEGIGSMTALWVATGRDFPDALSAAGPAGQVGQRLVLSPGSCLPKQVVDTWVNGPTSKIGRITLVGGSGVLSQSVASLKTC